MTTTPKKTPVLDYFRQGPEKWTKERWGADAEDHGLDFGTIAKYPETCACMCLGAALRFFYGPNAVLAYSALETSYRTGTKEFDDAVARTRKAILEVYGDERITDTNDHIDYPTLIQICELAQI